jgi:hypothetical protein
MTLTTTLILAVVWLALIAVILRWIRGISSDPWPEWVESPSYTLVDVPFDWAEECPDLWDWFDMPRGVA